MRVRKIRQRAWLDKHKWIKRSFHIGKSLWPGRINMGNDMYNYFNLEKNSYNLFYFFSTQVWALILLLTNFTRILLKPFLEIFYRHISLWKLLVCNVLIASCNYREFLWFENHTLLSAPYKDSLKLNKMKP